MIKNKFSTGLLRILVGGFRERESIVALKFFSVQSRLFGDKIRNEKAIGPRAVSPSFLRVTRGERKSKIMLDLL